MPLINTKTIKGVNVTYWVVNKVKWQTGQLYEVTYWGYVSPEVAAANPTDYIAVTEIKGIPFAGPFLTSTAATLDTWVKQYVTEFSGATLIVDPTATLFTLDPPAAPEPETNPFI